MQKRHLDRDLYFNEQAFTTEKYVIPFIGEVFRTDLNSSILEIGCGEGGNLKPFADKGVNRIVGVDLNEDRINIAKKKFSGCSNIQFLHADIYDTSNIGTFDVVIMRDVIEHIHDQNKFIGFLKKFLNPDGVVFFGFPPWQMPFGGHQQVCKSKILSRLPFFHLLPTPLYKLTLKLFKEQNNIINDLLEIKDTGISIERFQKIILNNSYKILRKELYFINPNYEIKFKLKPTSLPYPLRKIPFFRNFYTTAAYYVIRQSNLASS